MTGDPVTHALTPALDSLRDALAHKGVRAGRTADPAELIRGIAEARSALTIPLAALGPRLPVEVRHALRDWRAEAGVQSEALEAIADLIDGGA